MEHVYYVCDGSHCDTYLGSCQFCDGGLSACSVCGAFEGMWPDECPGKQMDYIMGDLVYKGIINFRDGNWYGECCQVMRPVYDIDNWMREQGYERDGVNNAGNPKWKKINKLDEIIEKEARAVEQIEWEQKNERLREYNE